MLLVWDYALRTSVLRQNRLKLFLRWGREEFEGEKSQMRQVQRE